MPSRLGTRKRKKALVSTIAPDLYCKIRTEAAKWDMPISTIVERAVTLYFLIEERKVVPNVQAQSQ